jgi:hypothetical protein
MEVPMRKLVLLVALFASVAAAAFPDTAESSDVSPVVHEEINRALEDLAGQVHRPGDRWRDHLGRPGDSPAERPLITLMLRWRRELALSPAQVESLERLRADFQREAARQDTELRAAEVILAGLLQVEPVDLASVETRVREIERRRADLRLTRIRTIEQGRAQLTADQRARLSALLAESAPSRLRASTIADGARSGALP